jgi:hypothetical protein
MRDLIEKKKEKRKKRAIKIMRTKIRLKKQIK